MGVLDRGERENDNGTGLKEGGIIEMSTTVLHSRAAPSLKYLPVKNNFDVKRKVLKNSNRVCKRVKYIYWVKKDLFGCFR